MLVCWCAGVLVCWCSVIGGIRVLIFYCTVWFYVLLVYFLQKFLSKLLIFSEKIALFHDTSVLKACCDMLWRRTLEVHLGKFYVLHATCENGLNWIFQLLGAPCTLLESSTCENGLNSCTNMYGTSTIFRYFDSGMFFIPDRIESALTVGRRIHSLILTSYSEVFACGGVIHLKVVFKFISKFTHVWFLDHAIGGTAIP